VPADLRAYGKPWRGAGYITLRSSVPNVLTTVQD
jgi:hypothetical protein